jgi:hypothetical protein
VCVCPLFSFSVSSLIPSHFLLTPLSQPSSHSSSSCHRARCSRSKLLSSLS